MKNFKKVLKGVKENNKALFVRLHGGYMASMRAAKSAQIAGDLRLFLKASDDAMAAKGAMKSILAG